MKLKYVMFDESMPVVFGEYFKHSDICVTNGAEPTSAGFCSIEKIPVKNDGVLLEVIKVECFGESASLKLKPSPYDARRLERIFNPANILSK